MWKITINHVDAANNMGEFHLYADIDFSEIPKAVNEHFKKFGICFPKISNIKHVSGHVFEGFDELESEE